MTRPEFDTQLNPRPWERINLANWEHTAPADHPADPHYVGTDMFRCHECNAKVRVKPSADDGDYGNMVAQI